MITRYTFDIVKYRAVKTVFCPCGKRVRRQTTFDQTINPYNRKADGQVKTQVDIMEELGASARDWEKRPELCSTCAKGGAA